MQPGLQDVNLKGLSETLAVTVPPFQDNRHGTTNAGGSTGLAKAAA